MNGTSFVSERAEEIYHPRAMRFVGLWKTDRAALRLCTISAAPEHSLDGALASARFAVRDRPLMACVWELVPIAFERDVYVRTVMSGKGEKKYLTQTLPDGSY